jgi:PadR family transcriptional regulator AphA
MSNGLNPLSHVVLALIGRGGAGPHDLVDMMRRGGSLFWSAAPSKLYAEPKRLDRLGYLSSRTEVGRTHPRTVYSLTEAGERALRAFVAEPTPFPRIQHEGAVRLVAGGFADDAALLASLRHLEVEIAALEALRDESEARAATLPGRERYLRLVGSLGRHLLAAHRAWLAEVEAELEPS